MGDPKRPPSPHPLGTPRRSRGVPRDLASGSDMAPTPHMFGTSPRAGARLVFLNASKPEQKVYATANAFGEFDANLPAGTWYLYVGETGQATYHKQITVGDRETVDYKVVSR